MLKPGTCDLSYGGPLICASAKENLIEFLALLIDAENADMTDVVMAARVDAP